ncbi:AMP-binding protein, partial [Streptomyces sp. NPDC001985]|uniref:AMP-binding protein n=1 Tax=Streptomyces sp. NPDC001985 TaxID=3154406 RepID=UPI00332E8E0F
RVVSGWNETARAVESGSLAELFEAQVVRSPGAVAVVGADREWSYAEVDAAADRVARALAGRGVGRGDLVGVLLERSPELVAVLLGVAKAGAGFVPVDPAYPVERIGYMLRDSSPALVVCSDSTARTVPSDVPRWVFDGLDSLGGVADHPGRPVPAARTGLDDTAYVIYTSGSTGRPKGVVVTHRGIGNLVAAQIAALDVGAESRVLQLSSLSFDASVWELCMALLSGAALVVPDTGSLPPHGSLEETAERFGVTHVTVPPSVLAPVGELPASVSTLVVAGEVCPPSLVERWSRGRGLVNAYGPTEVTVCASMTGALSPAGDESPVPIGGPLPNTRAYVLDGFLQPVPVGVAGELYVSGPG